MFGGDGNDSLSANDFGNPPINRDTDGGNDTLFGENGDDNPDSIDNVLNNDNLDSGPHVNGDTCDSDPDPETDCEI